VKRARPTRGRSNWPPAASTVVVLLLAAGCAKTSATPGDRTSPAVAASPASTSPATPGAKVWIAVFATADDPSALDRETAELSPILGSAIRVSPVQCFHRLPPEADTGYVIGAVADTRAALEAIVVQTGKTPIFEKEAREFCLD
jgi:hypothetical protein